MISAGIFRQYDIRGVVGTELTAEAAYAIGCGFGAMLDERHVTKRMVVSRDNRPSGTALSEALVRGLRETGVDVTDVGIVPTPVMYWCLHNLPVFAGIQITGSHNPPEFNGFKVCIGFESVYGDALQHLLSIIQAGVFPSGAGAYSTDDVVDRYVDDIVARTGPLPRRLKVVFDSGNGTGGPVMTKLFARLNVEPTYLFAESDGTFPNHHPDPTVEKNLRALITAVQRGRADIGIAFDGDADRIGIVDARGAIIWGDYLLILYARDVLARTGKGQSIIFDVKCSQALPDAIAKAGGVPVMWKTGHSLIKEKMKAAHAPLAGEMSGHMFFTEGFYGHDDALYGAARILRIVSQADAAVHDLLSDIPTYHSTPEIRVDCPDDKKFGIVAAATKHFKALYNVIDVDGVRIEYGDGWGLIRASNTQPILVVRFEATSQSRLDAISAEVEGWLQTQGVAFPDR
jgi:phosphomannomutase/phosphoglucomutase